MACWSQIAIVNAAEKLECSSSFSEVGWNNRELWKITNPTCQGNRVIELGRLLKLWWTRTNKCLPETRRSTLKHLAVFQLFPCASSYARSPASVLPHQLFPLFLGHLLACLQPLLPVSSLSQPTRVHLPSSVYSSLPVGQSCHHPPETRARKTILCRSTNNTANHLPIFCDRNFHWIKATCDSPSSFVVILTPLSEFRYVFTHVRAGRLTQSWATKFGVLNRGACNLRTNLSSFGRVFVIVEDAIKQQNRCVDMRKHIAVWKLK